MSLLLQSSTRQVQGKASRRRSRYLYADCVSTKGNALLAFSPPSASIRRLIVSRSKSVGLLNQAASLTFWPATRYSLRRSCLVHDVAWVLCRGSPNCLGHRAVTTAGGGARGNSVSERGAVVQLRCKTRAYGFSGSSSSSVMRVPSHRTTEPTPVIQTCCGERSGGSGLQKVAAANSHYNWNFVQTVSDPGQEPTAAAHAAPHRSQASARRT